MSSSRKFGSVSFQSGVDPAAHNQGYYKKAPSRKGGGRGEVEGEQAFGSLVTRAAQQMLNYRETDMTVPLVMPTFNSRSREELCYRW